MFRAFRAPFALSVLLAGCTSAGIVNLSELDYDGVVHRKLVTAAPASVTARDACRDGGEIERIDGDGSYRVGPGDELRFNIFGEPGMNQFTARVDGAGYVQLPIVELVQVGGKTTREIQKILKREYRRNFLDPWVTVELATAESRPIFYLGEFRQAGVRYLEHPRTLLEAVALGGGLTPEAYLPGARLIRNERICVVDLEALLKEGRFDYNVQVAGGDVLFAPRREDMMVYVLGAVTRPQGVAYGPVRRTLLEALTLAGGPITAKAVLSEVRVIRTHSADSGELLVIDAKRMLTGDALDFPLEPGDIVYVPQTLFSDWNDALDQIMPSLQAVGGVLTPIFLIESI